MNFSSFTVSKKWLAIGCILLLLSFAVIFASISLWQRSRASSVDTQGVYQDANAIEADAYAPLDPPMTAIEPMIKECLFSYFGACVQRIGPDFINTSNRYEDFAELDIPYITSFHHESSLPTYREPLSSELIQKYFPEYATVNPVPSYFTSAQILQRIAMRENVNPRLLLTLMEVFQSGQGPVLVSKRSSQYPFFDQPEGFAAQLSQVAAQLRELQLKYELQLQDIGTLPSSISFFDKKYLVSAGVSPASLAIAEFMSQNMKSRNQFERAVVVASTAKNSSNNFVELYTKIFQVDPIMNTEVAFKN